ncbi:MAG TPA: hypothetical protein VFI84_04145 [Candidatus Saccharimonadales bacterium]|nr:hypothetical protein [Candidatus Saccharimonadales bacterium]
MIRSIIIAATTIDLNPLPQAPSDQGEIKTILQILFGVIGALAFLFIVIAGLRYVISSGDPQDTAKAKSGIIYALAGLALALTAEIIVTWVIGQI